MSKTLHQLINFALLALELEPIFVIWFLITTYLMLLVVRAYIQWCGIQLVSYLLQSLSARICHHERTPAISARKMIPSHHCEAGTWSVFAALGQSVCGIAFSYRSPSPLPVGRWFLVLFSHILATENWLDDYGHYFFLRELDVILWNLNSLIFFMSYTRIFFFVLWSCFVRWYFVCNAIIKTILLLQKNIRDSHSIFDLWMSKYLAFPTEQLSTNVVINNVV